MRLLRCTTLPRLSLLLIALLFTACATQPGGTGSTRSAATGTTSLSPADASHYASAVANLQKGQFTEAAQALTGLVKKYPSHADAWLNLAVAQYSLDRLEEASAAIDQARQLQPDSVDVLNVTGLIQVGKGHYKDAETFYTKALSLDQRHAYVHYNMALLYDLYYQDIAKAVPHYEHYLALLGESDEETELLVDDLRHALNRGN